ncbi:MAG TPA: hypothetical protein VLI69_01540 [Gammaproteobacteria bacterium]|nr:hypothetical protein [Gammaproteobacteria bacterium]
MLVLPFVFYYSYSQNKNEKILLKKTLAKKQTALCHALFDYFLELSKQYLRHHHSLDHGFDLFVTKTCSHSLPNVLTKPFIPVFKKIIADKENLSVVKSRFDKSPPVLLRPQHSEMNLWSKITSVAIGFIGGCGSVAGCSAGLLGMLLSLGLLAGFAALPYLYIAGFGAGLLYGVAMSISSFKSAEKKHQKQQLIDSHESTIQKVTEEIRSLNYTAFQASQQNNHAPQTAAKKAKLSRQKVQQLLPEQNNHAPQTAAKNAKLSRQKVQQLLPDASNKSKFFQPPPSPSICSADRKQDDPQMMNNPKITQGTPPSFAFLPPSPFPFLHKKRVEEGGRSNSAHLYRSAPLLSTKSAFRGRGTF